MWPEAGLGGDNQLSLFLHWDGQCGGEQLMLNTHQTHFMAFGGQPQASSKILNFWWIDFCLPAVRGTGRKNSRCWKDSASIDVILLRWRRENWVYVDYKTDTWLTSPLFFCFFLSSLMMYTALSKYIILCCFIFILFYFSVWPSPEILLVFYVNWKIKFTDFTLLPSHNLLNHRLQMYLSRWSSASLTFLSVTKDSPVAII